MAVSGIEINSGSAICSKCGISYGRRKGNFPVNYGLLYKGIGYVTICKECIDAMYNGYLAQCNSSKDAVRQMCRKLDLYWSDKVFEIVQRKSTTSTMMIAYIAKINTVSYSGKSYDDTLSDEGNLWNWGLTPIEPEPVAYNNTTMNRGEQNDQSHPEISDEIVAFWGAGYTPEMYEALEQRRSYWMSRFPSDYELDIGTEAIIRQICSLELDINRDRAAGRAVDKSVNALNTLLGSASLKPTQKKGDTDASINNTPMGVWIDRFEHKRPIPDDVTGDDKNSLVRYILAWFYGHLSKMCGIKNANTKLYDEEISKYRVCKPEFDDDSDDDMMYDILSDEPDENYGDYERDDELMSGGDESNDEN